METSNDKPKIITMCCSIRYKDEMTKIALKLQLQENIVLTPIFPVNNSNKDDYTEKDIETLKKVHKEKIKMSDSIFVVNKDNYIGNSTKNEIEYAKSLNKKIIYYTDFK